MRLYLKNTKYVIIICRVRPSNYIKWVRDCERLTFVFTYYSSSKKIHDVGWCPRRIYEKKKENCAYQISVNSFLITLIYDVKRFYYIEQTNIKVFVCQEIDEQKILAALSLVPSSRK